MIGAMYRWQRRLPSRAKSKITASGQARIKASSRPIGRELVLCKGIAEERLQKGITEEGLQRGRGGAGEKGRAGDNAGGGAGGLCKLCGKIKVTYCKRAALRVK